MSNKCTGLPCKTAVILQVTQNQNVRHRQPRLLGACDRPLFAMGREEAAMNLFKEIFRTSHRRRSPF